MFKAGRLINSLYYLLFFLTPLLFTSQNSEFFELPKMYFVYALTLILAAIHLFNHLKGRVVLFRSTFLDRPLLLFLGILSLSTFFSIDTHTSIFGYYSRLNGGLLSLLSFSVLYWILAVYITDKLKKELILASFLSGLIVAFFGIVEHFDVTRFSLIRTIFDRPLLSPIYTLIHKGAWTQDVQNRVFSTFGQPNWLAAYLCILLPLTLEKALTAKNNLLRFTFFVLLLSFYTCLLFTKSKSGIIAAILTLGLYGLIQLRKNLKSPPKPLFAAYGLLIILSLFISNPIRDIIVRPPAPAPNPALTTLNITPSEDIRKIVWKGSLDLWRQFPLIGTGPETFAYSYYWTRPAAHNLTSEWNFLYNKAHNEYLNYLATTGTLGFIAYLSLIVAILFQLRSTIYLIPFLSILITNFSGFSVVITSLYFFLLPALALPSATLRPSPPKPKFYFLVFFLFLYLVSKIFFYFLADITYAQAISEDGQQQYSLSYLSLSRTLFYRPDEPVYLSKYADISAKMALLAQRDKQTEDVDKYTQNAIKAMDKATRISPFNLNLWKEQAQTYYYLSAIDSAHYLSALEALTKATKLAPTDAMSFYLLGKFYQNIDQFDGAITNYQRALELKPNYDHASFALGKLYFDQKKYDLALPLFETTLRITPANTDAQKFLADIATLSATKR